MVLLFSLVILSGVQPDRAGWNRGGERAQAATVRKAGSLRELERALSSQTDMEIILENHITVNRLLAVRGKKTINGNGKYQLIRKTGTDQYGGTLLYLYQGTLRLKKVTLNGGGRSGGARPDVNGKLVEVSAGMVILDRGTKLRTNYNTSSFTDGGGGITIHKGGKALMKKGSEICDNLTITGGSGVRVEAGGSFVMEGGTISGNAVFGQGEENDFDGRGGAIHNRGIVWIQGGVIGENRAVGYEKKGQVFGGFGGAVYNQNLLRITGGIIRDNQAALAGGAIYTNEAGTVSMEGGELVKNCARNQRGGGIYVSAASNVTIQGGKIWDNDARHGTQIFVSSTASGVLRILGGRISGTDDTVWNQGASVRISGGQITSTGCALRTMGNSEIRGGVLSGEKYGVYFGDGKVCLSGNSRVNRVYVKGECVLTADRKINLENRCELCPEIYREGKQLVNISSGEKEEQVNRFFSLKKWKRFLLEPGSRGLYIGRERYRIKFSANGGTGKMAEQTVYAGEKTPLSQCLFERDGYGFVGWSVSKKDKVTKGDISYEDRASVFNLGTHGSTVTLYALWVKCPSFTGQETMLSLYEGEFVGKKVLLYGMSAEDECDGDMTEQILVERVILPDHSERKFRDRLLTGANEIGTGKIVFRVTNSFGVCAVCQRRYEVLPHHPPEITAYDRYFFTGEYKNTQRQEAEKDILAGLRLRDDVESEEQLQKNLEVAWGALDFEKAGDYSIRCQVKDQYGNRFYMEPGVQQRYGSGKLNTKVFSIHVVDSVNSGTSGQEDGYVRFISPEYMDLLPTGSIWRQREYEHALEKSFGKSESEYEQVWIITGSDKKRIKKFIKSQEDPFSRETNDSFLERFSHLKKRRMEGGAWR